MPRRYYRPRRTVVVRPKKRWATNISSTTFQINRDGTAAQKVPGKFLVENTAQSAVPTPTILKVGNFKCSIDLALHYSSAPSYLPMAVGYIMFVPEGVVINEETDLKALVASHPEYILAWKQFDFEYITSSGSYSSVNVTFSSRLKRNLNSGDKIFLGIDSYGASALISVRMTTQFWTCAN